MSNNSFILILARGGSKRVPEKNMQVLREGETLLSRCVNTCCQTGITTYVSSESLEILDHAAEHGAEPLLRPVKFATDTASSVSAAMHACEKILSETIILVQVTSPFVSADDILGGLEMHKKTKKSIFAAVNRKEFLWGWSNDCPIFPHFLGVRSQDLPPVFQPCGAFYVASVEDLLTTESFFKPHAQPYELPVERALDIDNKMDLEFARYLCHQQQ